MWNFSYRDEVRRLITNSIYTEQGKPSRTERIKGMISGLNRWDDWNKAFSGGFGDMSQAVAYVTSHDIEKDHERRLMNYLLASLIQSKGGNSSFEQIRQLIDNLDKDTQILQSLHQQALDRVRSAYAILMTSVAIPMLLAGEEFADIHDTYHYDYRLKMSDPVDWSRREYKGHKEVSRMIADFTWLRGGHSALHRNEVEFFHFHPTIDENNGNRVFAYCRTNGLSLGKKGQVVVVANMKEDTFAEYNIPWYWGSAYKERGKLQERGGLQVRNGQATLALAPFEVRVFETY